MKRISVILALVLVSASFWCFHPGSAHAVAPEPALSAATDAHEAHCEVHDARPVASSATFSAPLTALPVRAVRLLSPPQLTAGILRAVTESRISADRSTLFRQFVLIQV